MYALPIGFGEGFLPIHIVLFTVVYMLTMIDIVLFITATFLYYMKQPKFFMPIGFDIIFLAFMFISFELRPIATHIETQ